MSARTAPAARKNWLTGIGVVPACIAMGEEWKLDQPLPLTGHGPRLPFHASLPALQFTAMNGGTSLPPGTPLPGLRVAKTTRSP